MHSSEFLEELEKREGKQEIIEKYKQIDSDFTDAYFTDQDIKVADGAWNRMSAEIQE